MPTELVKRVSNVRSLREYAKEADQAIYWMDTVSATWTSTDGGALPEDQLVNLSATVELPVLSASLAVGCRLVSQTDGEEVLNTPESVCEAFKMCTDRLFEATSLPDDAERSRSTALAYARRIAESGEMLDCWDTFSAT